VSDTHFGTERLPVVEALVALAARLRPELVVWSGDLTQRARRAQFDLARAVADRITVTTGAAMLAIPGNHDVPLFNLPARLAAPYRGFMRAFGANLAPVHRSARLLVIGVKTTRRWRHKDGEVSAAQVDTVARRLSAGHAAQLKVVVVHQPMVAITSTDRHNLLHGRAAAIAAWQAAGADLVLGGHIHLPYVATLAPGLWTAQAGTAVSRRTRGGIPNSVNVVRWPTTADSRVAALERWDYDEATRAFRWQQATVLPLGGSVSGCSSPGRLSTV
jgi:3',5'-cyclic AMP phosphodiesterase CpdA